MRGLTRRQVHQGARARVGHGFERGEATAASDVDARVVLDPNARIMGVSM